jgi:hypothetical protein
LLLLLLLLPMLLQLALVLLSEVKQGRASKFWDYLALLPGQVDVPALWSNEEIQQLRCPYFIEDVSEAFVALCLQCVLSATLDIS